MTGVAWLAAALGVLPGPDEAAAAAVAARAADVLRPAGALRRLDQVAVHMAAWQRTVTPAVTRPAGLVFAADHGVAAQRGVSAYPTDVTAAMVAAFAAGRGTVNVLAQAAGATVTVVDVGVGRPTGDIVTEAALDHGRAGGVVDAAVAAVTALDTDLLVIGEMGIGNTTAAAAVAHALLGADPGRWVGRGTGVDDAGLARKRDAVAAAVARLRAEVGEPAAAPLETLRQVGGAELLAMAAAVVAARQRSIPVLLDGYVVGAAVVPLALAAPDSLDHCLAGHCSAEPGHRHLLEHLGMAPLLDLDLRLGEASGAMAAVPLVRMACAAVVQVPTFAEWFGA